MRIKTKLVAGKFCSFRTGDEQNPVVHSYGQKTFLKAHKKSPISDLFLKVKLHKCKS